MGGLIWFVLGLGLCIESIKLGFGELGNPGAGFMPFISGTFLGLSGLTLTLPSILRRTGEGKSEGLKANWKDFLFTLLALFAYSLFLEPLGFLLSTFLFLFFLFKLGEPKKWFMPLVLSISTIILSYLIFSVFLKCQFPRGIFSIK